MPPFSFLLSRLRHPHVGLVLWLCSGLTVGAILLGAGSAFLIGFSKTGIPGAGMPAITLMADAFRDETKLSVGAMVPLLILGDLFGVLFYRRHANWHRLAGGLAVHRAGDGPGLLRIAAHAQRTAANAHWHPDPRVGECPCGRATGLAGRPCSTARGSPD